MLRTLVPYLVAIAVPWLALMASSHGVWLFDSGGADNWSYVRFFREWHLQDPIIRRALEGDYKAARLAWIIPGWAMWQAFGPTAGTVVLHTVFLVLAASAVAVLTSLLFGRRVALIVTAATVALPAVHGSSLGSLWYYHGNAALAAWLWGMAALTVAARTGGMRWAWLSGATFFCAVSTDVIYGVFLPVVLLHGAALWRNWKRLPYAIGWAIVGAASTFLLLALLSVSVGGPFWYPRQLITAALGTADPSGLNRSAFATWLPHAVHLTLALVVFIGSVAASPWIVRQRQWMVSLVVAEFLVALGTLAALEWGGYATLQTPFWAFTLTGPMLVALAGLITLSAGDLAGMPPLWIAATATGSLTAPQVLLEKDELLKLRGLADPIAAMGWPPQAWAVPLAVGLVGLLCLMAARRTAGLLAIGLVMVGVSAAAASLRPGALSIGEHCEIRQDELAAVLAVADAVPSDARSTALLWYDARELLPVAGCPPQRLRAIGVAAAQVASLANVSELGTTPADIPDRFLDPRTRPGRTWVVLGGAPTIEASVAALRSRRAIRLLDSRSVEAGTIRFEVRILRVSS